MSENFSINIRLYVIVALGGNSFLHEEIDTIYEEKKLDYYHAYKLSGFYDDITFKTYMIDKEARMKKVAGIVEWCYKHNDLTLIYRLLKKGFKFSWNFMKNQNYISIDEFALSFQKKRGKDFSEQDMFFHCIALMYLCYQEKIHLDLQSEFGRYFQQMFVNHVQDIFTGKILFTEENFKESRNELDGLYQDFYVSPKTSNTTLELLFDNIISVEEKKIGTTHNMSKEKYGEVRKSVFENGISKYIGAYAGWIKALGFNESDLTSSVRLSKEDLDSVFFEYINAQHGNNIEEQDKLPFIVGLFFIQALVTEYKKSKDVYFNQLQDDFYFELGEYEKELAEKEKDLKEAKESFEAEKKKVQEENDKLWEELKRLQKENASLKGEVDTLHDHSKEVFALREFIYSLKNEEEEEVEGNQMEMMIEELQTIKMAVIGGSQSWVNKVKEVFPNFIMVNQDNKGIDLRFLDNVDVVCINTKTFNHSFYEKAMKQMSKNDVPFFYLNGNYNIDITVSKIYRQEKVVTKRREK
ncbi:hypothetical protein [Bacillus sp. M6-12]|uniref:hypothetical protein n=1 Tax=Bacillus sp. M6-12 TaxID=2054166 RepID=UPI0015E14276|nr:hypothetical protein [Bacillus sp. M6-12]